MNKTITLRINADSYNIFKLAAQGEKRNISNLIEYAALRYLTSKEYVSKEEMNEIMADEKLLKNLKSGLNDIKNGKFTIAE